MQGGATPLRWTWKWGNWIARPEDESSLEPLAQEVVDGVRAIAKAFRRNVDLEWVWDGKKLVWVQMREITALNNLNVYSNRMAKEMLPGAIKPLIWSENIPLVNAAWIRVLEEAVGFTGLQPEDLAKAIHYHVYFNMTALGRVFNLMGFPSEGLEMMTGTVPKEAGKAVFRPGWKSLRILPRFALFLFDKWHFSVKMERFLNRAPAALGPLVQEIQRLENMDLKQRLEIIRRLRRHVNEAAYYNILGPLLMSMYGQLLKAQLRRLGVEFADFDLTFGMQEVAELDPAVHLNRLNLLYQELPVEVQAQVQEGCLGELRLVESAKCLAVAFDEFIERFGHLSDSGNDFSVAPWREMPESILRLVAQHDTREEPGERIRRENLRVGGISRWFLDTAYRRARQFRLYREQISSYYTRIYGYFRVAYLSVGRSLAGMGILRQADDIFYLSRTEVEAAIDGHTTDWQELARQRRMEVEASRGLVLPAVVYGDEVPPAQAVGKESMHGTPTSRGYYTGPVCVVEGIGDFHKVMKGDVLVVPFSEVSWTPLFAKAGAVVAESGGMLSHSSIIAREYQIPAVVSVEGATRLRNGVRVTVDGYRGIVTVLEEG
jgi:pyruvate,water dikinase